MQADYSYILTTAGWGLGTNPNRVQKGNRGTKQNPLSSSSDFVLCELNTFEEPLSKEWMGTTAMMTFTLRLSTNPMKKQDFYYNATPKAPPKREYGEAIRPGKLPAVATAKLFWVGRVWVGI